MKRTSLTALFALVTAITFSQSTLSPGYLIMNAGDTVRGEIENNDWKINPSSIRFLPAGATSPATYNTSEIKAFYLTKENELFYALKTTVSQAPDDPAQITVHNYNIKAEKAFFARVLVQGRATLHYMYDVKPHYFIEKEGLLQELIVQRTPSNADPNNTLPSSGYQVNVKTLEHYKGVLNSVFLDCPALSKKVFQVRLRADDLTKVVTEYNQCKDGKVAFAQTKESSRTEFGILGGVTFTTHSITGSSTAYPHMVNSNYDNSIDPTLGVYLNIVSPRRNGRYAWYNELGYSRFESQSEYVEEELYDSYYENHSAMSYLQYFSGVRVRYEQPKTRPFFSFGISGSVALSKEFYTNQTRYLNDEYVDETTITHPIRTFSFGLWAGAGLALGKRMDLQARWHKTQGYANSVSYQANVSTYYLTVGVRLGKSAK